MNPNDLNFSRRALLQSLAGVAALAGRSSTAWAQTPKRHVAPVPTVTAPFQTPLFAGDYADPSILRVGSDFYITSTSYRYAPGLPVWHSRDLVNWTHISNGLDRSYGEVWAPDFIEHRGRYFIYFPLDGGLFAVHAADPRGLWSAPVDLKLGGIDPGHVVRPGGTRHLH